MWQNARLVAVIDWEDFGVGDALADLSCARLELLWATNAEEVDRFTEIYLRASGRNLEMVATSIAYWDLRSVLPFAHMLSNISASQADRGQKRQQLAGFVRRAAAVLGVSLDPNQT